MTQISPSLRKAAVLISALDTDAADALLQQVGAEEAAKIRSALVELEKIPEDEQRRVLAEFLGQQHDPRTGAPVSDDVTLEIRSDVEATLEPAPRASAARVPDAVQRPSFDFLQRVDPSAIAAVLHRELPQTVAVVVAHLPPEQAAAVLQALPGTLATEALERMAWIDELSADVQFELVRALETILAPHIRTAAADPSSLERVSAILGAMESRQRHRLVSQLGQRNQPLVDRIGLTSAGRDDEPSGVFAMRYRLDSESASKRAVPQRDPSVNTSGDDSVWLTFNDLLQFDDVALRAVFAATDADVALLALTGAEPRLIARILRKLAYREATVLRERLEHPGPLRLRDVEQARFAVAAVASRLAHEGAIELPKSVRFAAAI
jgi:flagellar motor switch protein FliG